MNIFFKIIYYLFYFFFNKFLFNKIKENEEAAKILSNASKFNYKY